MLTIKEYEYLGNRTHTYKTKDIKCIRSYAYVEQTNTTDFMGYEYAHDRKSGTLAIFLKNGERRYYPASNWQIEFN